MFYFFMNFLHFIKIILIYLVGGWRIAFFFNFTHVHHIVNRKHHLEKKLLAEIFALFADFGKFCFSKLKDSQNVFKMLTCCVNRRKQQRFRKWKKFLSLQFTSPHYFPKVLRKSFNVNKNLDEFASFQNFENKIQLKIHL